MNIYTNIIKLLINYLKAFGELLSFLEKIGW